MFKKTASKVPSKQFLTILSVAVAAQMTSACVTSKKNSLQGDANFITGSIKSDKSSLQQTNAWAKKWRENPRDSAVAISYARALRSSGSANQAASILQQASIAAPKNQAVIAEYGKTLAATGQLTQAMHNLNRAQALGKPDWRIYSAQGIVLDKLSEHKRAREYYKSALNLNPNQPAILNNIGMSYALEGKLPQAESYLRRAANIRGSKSKVKKNLALILGLGGKFNQSEKASSEVLDSADTSKNISFVKNMISQPGTWQTLAGAKKSKGKVVSQPIKLTNTKKKRKNVSRKKYAAVKATAPKTTGSASAFKKKMSKALAQTKMPTHKPQSIESLGLRINK